MDPEADLSPRGIARLVQEQLAVLDLKEVTVAGVDTGGALAQLLMSDDDERLSRAVLASCDAFENFPAGLTGKALVLAGKLPPTLLGLFMQQMRLRAARRLPIGFGWLTKRGDTATARWLRPLLTQKSTLLPLDRAGQHADGQSEARPSPRRRCAIAHELPSPSRRRRSAS